jgi:hypothetical protein
MTITCEQQQPAPELPGMPVELEEYRTSPVHPPPRQDA